MVALSQSTNLIIGAFGQTVFMLLLAFVAIFLILLVLVQRGRGGGLAGALGGMGGSSAFGAKAGDVFTKITVVAATLWILLCIAATKMTPDAESLVDTKVSSSASDSLEESPGLSAPANTDTEGDSAADAADESTTGEATAEGEPSSDDSTPSSEKPATEEVEKSGAE